MADDIFSTTYTADDLRTKYKNYATPAAKVSVGTAGTDLASGIGVQIESISVSLSLDSAASASISVTGIYDLGTRALKSSVTSNLNCGTAIKIELGYGSEFHDVFHGFIYETGIQFSDTPTMQITAMDVKRLMADNTPLSKSMTGKKVSDIFTEVMGNYSALKLSTSVDSQHANDAVGTLVQRGSDLSLIRKLCRDRQLTFFVYGDSAMLVEKKDTKAKNPSVTTLSWGSDILSLSYNRTYINTEIIVKGVLSGNTEATTQSQTVKSAGNISDMPTTKRVIELTNITAEDELADRLADEVESLKESMYSSQGSCIGLPVLLPGRYIKIDGIDSTVNGEYYLKTVSHSFGSDGFTTNFTLGGKRSS